MDKKIEETREFLQTIGMPKAQQADICCYVILAMAGIKPDNKEETSCEIWISSLTDRRRAGILFFVCENQRQGRNLEEWI